MKTLKQTYNIHADRQSLWNTLTNPKIIENWSGAKAEMDLTPGGEFKLWGGDIWGKNLETIPGEKLVQEWWGGKWEKPSKLTIVLTEAGNETMVHLFHEELPAKEYKAIEEGWKLYYWGPVKEYLSGRDQPQTNQKPEN